MSDIISILVPSIAIALPISIYLYRRSKGLKKSDAPQPAQAKTNTSPAPSQTPELPTQQEPKAPIRLSPFTKTKEALKNAVSSIFKNDNIYLPDLEPLYEALYRADLGVQVTELLISHLREKMKVPLTQTQVFELLQEKIATLFTESPENFPEGPRIILVVGINGAGKTTSIGKLAHHFKAQGKKVLLGAGDTYRAAAIDQLKIWSERTSSLFVASTHGADPASVAFDAIKVGLKEECDVIIIDTAGRLHNKANLMEELSKVKQVMNKAYPNAPHETWIVVDGTSGQNAIQQVKIFHEVTKLSGLIVSKLDGTAKGGAIIGISNQFKLPIRYIGTGEQPSDIQVFSAKEFCSSLFS